MNPGLQRIEAANFVTLFQEQIDGMRTDELGSPGDQDLHQIFTITLAP